MKTLKYENMKKFKSKAIQSGIKSTLDAPENGQKAEQLAELYNQDSTIHFKKPLGNTRVIMLALIIAAFFGLVSGFTGVFLFFSGAFGNIPILQDISLEALMPSNSVIVEHKQQVIIQEEERIDQVVKQASQVVVGIFKQKIKGETVLDDIYLGSDLVTTGFILTEDGWVVASNQKINPDENYIIVTANKKIHPVESVVIDSVSQTAWLKIDASNLPVATLVKKENLAVGHKVVALKSSINNHLIDIFQTRLAKLNWKDVVDKQSLLRNSDKFDLLIKVQNNLPPGFQGSPLVNLAGEFIGLGLSDSTILPVENIKQVIPQVLKSGLVVRPHLGISYLDLSQSVGAKIELILSEDKRQDITQGALVTSLAEHGPSDKAEVKVNDIITKVDGLELDGLYNLSQAVLEKKVGDEISLTIWRAEVKEPLEIKVILE